MKNRRIRATRLGRHTTEDSLEVSCGVLDVMEGEEVVYRVVTDCGISPQNEADGSKTEITPDLSFFEDGKKIDLVRVTHVHLDHAGGLPLLTPYLAPRANVLMSLTSAAMLNTVFDDSLRINARRGTAPLYDAQQCREIMNRTWVMRRPGEIEIFPGITDYVHPAGHMPGACSFTTRLGKVHVHYAGDRCSHDQPGTLGATPIPAEWRRNCIVLGCDCTYGADPDSDKRVRQDELEKAVAYGARAMAKGAPALYCTFATRGRTLAADLQRYHLPDQGPVFLDGSTRTYANIIGDPDTHWSDRDSAAPIEEIQFVEALTKNEANGRESLPGERRKDQFHRDAIARNIRGYAVVTTSGMFQNGPSNYWREHVLENPDAALVFTGYMAPGDGQLVLDAAKRRETDGHATVTFREEGASRDAKTGRRVRRTFERTYQLKCQVIQTRLGAHESRSGILDWFQMEMQPMAAVLNHGSRAALESLAGSLQGTPGLQALHMCHTEQSVTFDI